MLKVITRELAERENLLRGEVKADIFVLNKKRKVLKQVVSSKNKDLRGRVIQYQLGEGSIGKVILLGSPMLIDFLALNSESSALTDQEKELFRDMKSLLVKPIFHPDTNEAVAVLLVYSKEKRLDTLTEKPGSDAVTDSTGVISRMLNYANSLPT